MWSAPSHRNLYSRFAAWGAAFGSYGSTVTAVDSHDSDGSLSFATANVAHEDMAMMAVMRGSLISATDDSGDEGHRIHSYRTNLHNHGRSNCRRDFQ
jgi:hypothetical protein